MQPWCYRLVNEVPIWSSFGISAFYPSVVKGWWGIVVSIDVQDTVGVQIPVTLTSRLICLKNWGYQMVKPLSVPWMMLLSDSNMDLYLQSELLVSSVRPETISWDCIYIRKCVLRWQSEAAESCSPCIPLLAIRKKKFCTSLIFSFVLSLANAFNG